MTIANKPQTCQIRDFYQIIAKEKRIMLRDFRDKKMMFSETQTIKKSDSDMSLNLFINSICAIVCIQVVSAFCQNVVFSLLYY